mmetsp:Transcript_12078/g.12967  ORF Transcript_12078/g.12967 Transcript_12078/m.12967 type:complete len:91 (+) Transcript_12078:116-388(+)
MILGKLGQCSQHPSPLPHQTRNGGGTNRGCDVTVDDVPRQLRWETADRIPNTLYLIGTERRYDRAWKDDYIMGYILLLVPEVSGKETTRR